VQTLQTYAGDVCLFLLRALEDTFHDIKKAACACICMLTARCPPAAIEAHAERMLHVRMAVASSTCSTAPASFR
jgi:hypothetical protein